MLTSSIELTPEIEYALTEELLELTAPTTPTGILWFNKGYDREALRFERCGKVRFRRCPNHHIDRRARYNCGNRFVCSDCAQTNSRELLEAWTPTLKRLQREAPSSTCVFLEIYSPTARDKKAIHAFLKSLTKSLFHAFAGFPPIHYLVPSQFVGAHLKTRALLIVDPGVPIPQDWTRVFSTSMVSARTAPAHRLLHVFEHDLLTPPQIPDLRDRVEQEILFKGVHRLRAIGIQKDKGEGGGESSDSIPTCESASDISVVENASTEKSHSRKPSHDRCLTCGEKFTHESRDLHLAGERGDLIEWLEVFET